MIKTILILLLIFSQCVFAAKIYKWKDAEGRTHFSYDPPVNTDTKEIKLKDKSVFDEFKPKGKCSKEEYLVGEWHRLNDDGSVDTKISMGIRERYRMSGEKEYHQKYVTRGKGRIAHKGSWKYKKGYIYFKQKEIGKSLKLFPVFDSALVVRSDSKELHLMIGPRNTIKFQRYTGGNNWHSCTRRKK